MATYWISFRLSVDSVGGRTYEERWDALNTAITNAATSTNYWCKTSSFYVFASEYSIIELGRRFKATIAPSVDVFLMRQIDSASAVICGNNDDADIFTLMPYLSKI